MVKSIPKGTSRGTRCTRTQAAWCQPTDLSRPHRLTYTGRQGSEPSQVPLGEVFNAPDDSGRLCVGESTLDNFDYSGRNSRPLVVPPDSFTGIGESYPANGGLDGRS